MIRTRYDIAVEIDDETFHVTLSEPTKVHKEELRKAQDHNIETFKKRDDLAASLNEKQEEFNLNIELIKESKVVDKLSLLLEQKKLNKEIHKLKRELNEIDEKLDSVQDMIEKQFKKRFLLTVSGADKDRLKAVLDEKGISFQQISQLFAQKIVEEKEKK